MKVSDLRQETAAGRARICASVDWEECDRPAREIYVETDAEFGKDIHPDPNSFLLAAIMPALIHGESRLLVEGSLCPKLRNGLDFAMQQLLEWHGRTASPRVSIEASEGFASPMTGPSARAASFMSGGADALSTLHTNRIDYALEHPASIRDCLFVHGADIGGYEDLDGNEANSTTAIASLEALAAAANFTLIPVWTNFRHLDDSDTYFYYFYHGSMLAGVAHAFSRRITTMMIASSSSVHDLGRIGSHPLLDPNYGSYWLNIQHDGVRFERIEKVRILSTWEAGLRTLRSCFHPFRDAQDINCGRCEKCIRTMTALLIHGVLDKVPTYPCDDVSAELIESILVEFPAVSDDLARPQLVDISVRQLSPSSVFYWQEMIGPLRALGRDDLADPVARKVRRYWKLKRRQQQNPFFREMVKGLDEQFLDGRLRSLYRRLKDA